MQVRYSLTGRVPVSLADYLEASGGRYPDELDGPDGGDVDGGIDNDDDGYGDDRG